MVLGPRECTSLPVRVSPLGESELEHRFQIRSIIYFGLRSALVDAGMLERVTTAMPSATAATITRPPAPWSFAPALPFQHALWALEQSTDAMGIRRVGRQTVSRGPIRWLQFAIRSTIASTGGSPHPLFRGLARAVASHARGLSVTYRPLREQAGELCVRYEWLEQVTASAFLFWEGVASLAFDLAPVAGTVATVSSEVQAGGVVGTLRAEWIPRAER